MEDNRWRLLSLWNQSTNTWPRHHRLPAIPYSQGGCMARCPTSRSSGEAVIRFVTFDKKKKVRALRLCWNEIGIFFNSILSFEHFFGRLAVLWGERIWRRNQTTATASSHLCNLEKVLTKSQLHSSWHYFYYFCDSRNIRNLKYATFLSIFVSNSSIYWKNQIFCSALSISVRLMFFNLPTTSRFSSDETSKF